MFELVCSELDKVRANGTNGFARSASAPSLGTSPKTDGHTIFDPMVVQIPAATSAERTKSWNKSQTFCSKPTSKLKMRRLNGSAVGPRDNSEGPSETFMGPTWEPRRSSHKIKIES